MSRAGDLRFVDVAEGAVLVEFPGDSEERANRRAVAAAGALAGKTSEGVFDAIPGACTLLAVFDPRRLSRARLADDVSSSAVEGGSPGAPRRILELPVFYDSDPRIGPDLWDLSSGSGLSREEFVRRHASAEYRVAFLGFAPGFAYLTGLAPELHAPRLSTPRTRVPAGSVGIGGAYTGIYPEASPGGWRLIGRAPVRLFEVTRDPPSLLLPGDGVHLRRIGREEFERRREVLEAQAGSAPIAGQPLFRVIAPGALTSVQGAARRGWGIYGVPPGGAMDLEALSFGNAALGNPPGAAALELTLVGPELEVLGDAVIAFSGGVEATLDGRPIGTGTPLEVRAGDHVGVGPLRGTARAYLCVAGGLALPERPQASRRLAAGDTILASAPAVRRLTASTPPRESPAPASEILLRVLPGPQRERFEPEGMAAFLAGEFRVSASSDRCGIRLEGPAIVNRESPDIPPEGTTLGAIQVPRDGQPIILGPDRPATGGYAKIATVIEANFPSVGRALPGTVVRFVQVTLEEAVAALEARAPARSPGHPE